MKQSQMKNIAFYAMHKFLGFAPALKNIKVYNEPYVALMNSAVAAFTFSVNSIYHKDDFVYQVVVKHDEIMVTFPFGEGTPEIWKAEEGQDFALLG